MKKCVCTYSGSSEVIHDVPKNGNCPMTMPSSWMPTSSPEPTTTTTHSWGTGEVVGYDYTYWDSALGGAKILCQSSEHSTMGVAVGTMPVVATLCAGHNSTAEPPIKHWTSATVVSADAFNIGNWGFSKTEATDEGPSATSSERNELATSIYSAMKTLCSDSAVDTKTYVPTTSWNDAINSFAKISVTKTMKHCATQTVEVMDTYYLKSLKNDTDVADGPGDGTIEIEIKDSWFDPENLDGFLWKTAFTWSQQAMQNVREVNYNYGSHGGGFAGSVYEPDLWLKQYIVPSEILITHGADFSHDSVEAMWTKLHLKESAADEMACVEQEEMLMMAKSFAEFVVPELAPEIEVGADIGLEAMSWNCAEEAGTGDN